MTRKIRIVEHSRGTVVADRAVQAGSAAARMQGLLGRDGMQPGEGMVLPRSPGIHTWGMRFPIDVVFCNNAGIIVRIVHRMEPGRMVFCWRGRGWTLELAAGEAGRCALSEGDRLVMESCG